MNFLKKNYHSDSKSDFCSLALRLQLSNVLVG